MSETERTSKGSLKGVGGRPPGSPNKTTLFKQAMRDGFEAKLEKDGVKVFDAVVQKAIGPPSKDEEGNTVYLDGDMAAAKMILDRIVPVQEQSQGAKGAGNIVINVKGMEASIDLMDSKPVIDVESE